MRLVHTVLVGCALLALGLGVVAWEENPLVLLSALFMAVCGAYFIKQDRSLMRKLDAVYMGRDVQPHQDSDRRR